MGITNYLKKKVEEKQAEKMRKMELRQEAREERYKGYKNEMLKIEREKGRKMARGDTEGAFKKAGNLLGGMAESVGQFASGYDTVFGPPKKKRSNTKTIRVVVTGAKQVKKKKKRQKHPYEL
jgi:hypothetical protein